MSRARNMTGQELKLMSVWERRMNYSRQLRRRVVPPRKRSLSDDVFAPNLDKNNGNNLLASQASTANNPEQIGCEDRVPEDSNSSFTISDKVETLDGIRRPSVDTESHPNTEDDWEALQNDDTWTTGSDHTPEVKCERRSKTPKKRKASSRRSSLERDTKKSLLTMAGAASNITRHVAVVRPFGIGVAFMSTAGRGKQEIRPVRVGRISKHHVAAKVDTGLGRRRTKRPVTPRHVHKQKVAAPLQTVEQTVGFNNPQPGPSWLNEVTNCGNENPFPVGLIRFRPSTPRFPYVDVAKHGLQARCIDFSSAACSLKTPPNVQYMDEDCQHSAEKPRHIIKTPVSILRKSSKSQCLSQPLQHRAVSSSSQEHLDDLFTEAGEGPLKAKSGRSKSVTFQVSEYTPDAKGTSTPYNLSRSALSISQRFERAVLKHCFSERKGSVSRLARTLAMGTDSLVKVLTPHFGSHRRTQSEI